MMSRALHFGMDAIMCGMMNVAQWRLRDQTVTRKRLEEYLAECSTLDRPTYYATPEEKRSSYPNSYAEEWNRDRNHLSWNSPLAGPWKENQRAHADLYEISGEKRSGAPTVILLHSLMSANDFGYRRVAKHFNRKGWNVLFPHFPFHYRRRLRGRENGSLTITSDLIRNAETIRQSVIELRQLMSWIRRRGCHRIALLGTSYGAWVAALTLSLEKNDFSILLQPIVDPNYATFGSPASRVMSVLLKRNGVHPHHLEQHAHLISPGYSHVMTPPDRITVIGGRYDRLSPSSHLISLCRAWGGARYREVDQGHFGYGAMQCALAEAEHFLERPRQDVHYQD